MRRFGGVVLAFGAMLVLSACAGKTTGATKITEVSATLHASARCDKGESCTWYWEYWRADQPRSTSTKTALQGPVSGPTGSHGILTDITPLTPHTMYRWVFCASPDNGAHYACAGPHGTFGSTTADPPPDHATFTTAAPGTLSERWDGTHWTIQRPPNPSGAQSSSLSGVSCTSATACTAVGDYINSAGTEVTLAEVWDGTSWTIQRPPNPSGGQSSSLSGLSCTSATDCTAVGSYHNSAGTLVQLAERWGGTSWTIEPTPNLPTGATYSALFGVSCTGTTTCTAVGNYYSGTAQVTLAEHWDGTSWTIQPTAPSPTQEASLGGVSCASATACTAVGYFDAPTAHLAIVPFAQAESWNGTIWTSHPTPTGPMSDSLDGVSCTSAMACTAVGYYVNSAGTPETLAEHWDGTTWTIQPTPNGEVSLSAVSCTSATACSAVGDYVSTIAPGTTGELTLAEAWDGTTWTIQPTPNSTGRANSFLNGVSCTSTTKCTAVGSQ